MSKVTRFPDKVVANSITCPKRITIDEVKGTRITGDVTFTNVLDLCLGAIVQNAFHVVELTVADHAKSLDASPARDPQEIREKKIDAMRKAVTEHLFDQMNTAFSTALGMFAPHIVQHPGLTELAIQKAEDEIITAYLESLPEDEREAATKAAGELMSQSKRKLLEKIAAIDEMRLKEEAAFVPLTPEQDAALKVLADEDATEEAQTQAKAYLEANPLPCMTPAVEPGDTFSLEVTPSPEELEAAGDICGACGITDDGERCKACAKVAEPVTPAAKILSGLE